MAPIGAEMTAKSILVFSSSTLLLDCFTWFYGKLSLWSFSRKLKDWWVGSEMGDSGIPFTV